MDPIVLLILLGLLSGLFSGFLAGLLGIGGGVIIVPLLFYSFHAVSFPQDFLMKFAVGTSLATAVVATALSSFVHAKEKLVVFSYLKSLIPGLIFGSISGALLASILPDLLLKKLFGVLAFLIGFYFLLPKNTFSLGSKPNSLLLLASLGVGHLSSLLGVGGGIFILPILYGYPLTTKQATATSSVATFATSLAGTLLYLFLPEQHPDIPFSIGWINLPSFGAISIASLFSVHLGSKAASILPGHIVKRIFGICLALTGIEFFF